MGFRFAEKTRIARLAASLVEPGDTLLLEAGSTVSMLAEQIRDQRSLTVITPNLLCGPAVPRARRPGDRLGGLYQEASESFVGPVAKNALAELTFSKCFLGVTGFTQEFGFTLNDSLRAEVTQEILSKGATSYVLTDSSKFGASHVAPIAGDLSQIHTVITDPESLKATRAIWSRRGFKC